jgi:hypothetical protein
VLLPLIESFLEKVALLPVRKPKHLLPALRLLTGQVSFHIPASFIKKSEPG